MQLIKIHNKQFNPRLLDEELTTAGIRDQLTGVNWVGFHRTPGDRYRMTPNAQRQDYARKTGPGGVVILEADPGEIHFEVIADPGQPFDDVLDAHDAAGQSQDEQEENALISLAQQLNSVYQAGGPNNQQMQQFVRGLWRLLRRLIRITV